MRGIVLAACFGLILASSGEIAQGREKRELDKDLSSIDRYEEQIAQQEPNVEDEEPEDDDDDEEHENSVESDQYEDDQTVTSSRDPQEVKDYHIMRRLEIQYKYYESMYISKYCPRCLRRRPPRVIIKKIYLKAHCKGPARQKKPPVTKTKPPVTKAKPPALKAKPQVSKPRPPVSKTRPPVTKAKPPVSKTKPPVPKTKPPVSKTRPPALKAKPQVSKPRPPVSKTRPPAPKAKSQVSKPRPPISKPKPPVSKTRPPAPKAKSQVSKPRPPVSKTRPPAPKAKQITPESPLRSPTRTIAAASAEQSCPTICKTKFTPLGCTRRRGLLNHDIFHLIGAKDRHASLKRRLCQCAAHAKARGHQYFGMHGFYSVCWNSPTAPRTYSHDRRFFCVNTAFKKCDKTKDCICSGQKITSFVYKLHPAP